MFYDFAVTIEAGITKASPVTQDMKLTRGVIHRVEIQFPPGCSALAHIALDHEGHQFIPTNPDGDFASDDYVIPVDEFYELKSSPYQLKARAWNEDDTYAHTITVRIGILPAEVLSPLFGLGATLRKFLKFVGIGS